MIKEIVLTQNTHSNTAELLPVPAAGHDGLLIAEQVRNTLLRDVANSTKRVYEIDAKQFYDWCVERGYTIETIGYGGLVEFKDELLSKKINNKGETYHKGTAARKLVVARRLLEVAVLLGIRQDNPATKLKAIKDAANQETTHRALTLAEAKQLLDTIPQGTVKGKRDFALIMLMLRTGIRRAEAAALTIGDLSQSQGHAIATIQRGKGNKRRVIKLPVDVLRAIKLYLEAAGRSNNAGEAPLFANLGKYGRGEGDKPMTGFDIERRVTEYAKEAGLTGLTPHGLRASFVTLSLEGGAALQQVQYAAGHSDPRTTERYQRRKLNLDNNAVDFIRL